MKLKKLDLSNYGFNFDDITSMVQVLAQEAVVETIREGPRHTPTDIFGGYVCEEPVISVHVFFNDSFWVFNLELPVFASGSICITTTLNYRSPN